MKAVCLSEWLRGRTQSLASRGWWATKLAGIRVEAAVVSTVDVAFSSSNCQSRGAGARRRTRVPSWTSSVARRVGKSRLRSRMVCMIEPLEKEMASKVASAGIGGSGV